MKNEPKITELDPLQYTDSMFKMAVSFNTFIEYEIEKRLKPIRLKIEKEVKEEYKDAIEKYDDYLRKALGRP